MYTCWYIIYRRRGRRQKTPMTQWPFLVSSSSRNNVAVVGRVVGTQSVFFRTAKKRRAYEMPTERHKCRRGVRRPRAARASTRNERGEKNINKLEIPHGRLPVFLFFQPNAPGGDDRRQTRPFLVHVQYETITNAIVFFFFDSLDHTPSSYCGFWFLATSENESFVFIESLFVVVYRLAVAAAGERVN